MAAITLFKTKDTVITIGSTEEQSRIISDITLSFGEKDEVDFEAIDGVNYAFAGDAGKGTITFDYLQGTNYNITEMVYGPESTSSDPILHTLNHSGTGEAKTITLANVITSTSQVLTVTLTDVEGISAPINYTKGEAVMRTFTGIFSSSNAVETVLEAA